MRDKYPEALGKAIEACKEQISVSKKMAEKYRAEGGVDKNGNLTVEHYGFKQLAIIYEKQGNYEKAIEVLQEAMQQGWAGPWQFRIDRCKRKKSD